ncbi:hypothetical protein F5Y10DRAFT_291963 [Nemania abortiva]|nr:hypothetical protein F5Y10DRAFT_291963 [Nemania abortiva]
MARSASQDSRNPRRAVRPFVPSLPLASWDGTTSSFNSSHPNRCPQSSPPNEYPSNPRPKSPTWSRVLKPLVIKPNKAHPFTIPPPHFGDGPRGSLKRKAEDDGLAHIREAIDFNKLPAFLRDPLPRDPSSLQTPDATPEPSESRRSFYSADDPITRYLNNYRPENKLLEPIDRLCDLGYLNQATHAWAAPVEDFHEVSYQQPSPPREVKRRRVQSPETTHCNIKYNLEELDYIRYQRVDLQMKWHQVEASFTTMFPMVVFPKPRKAQGLQGVNYRQNKFLPNIKNGRLVFMDNGHVEPVCVKTRDQTERKDFYTLVYLFPERAMHYLWVQHPDRERAAELSINRKRQVDKARRDAEEAGTYMEKLPADVPCGCCPGEDRERDKKKRAENKKTLKKSDPGYADLKRWPRD